MDAPTATGGIGFSGLLTIVFITLKLIGKIDWSWWWVLAPIWIPAALVIGCVLIAATWVTLAPRRWRAR